MIGYGNDLRGDDAVGPLAAAAVAAWGLPGVQTLVVHQLLPELAEALAAADLAIFVDARVLAAALGQGQPGLAGAGKEAVAVHPVEPAAGDLLSGHTSDPQALLALAVALYGRCPPAWSITVPARGFEFGAGLSPAARRGLAVALAHVRGLIREKRPLGDLCAASEGIDAKTQSDRR